MRIAIVQYGVIKEAFDRFRAGGPETFYAQRYSVEFVASLAERHEFVGVCGFQGEAAGDSRLSPRLHSACIPLLKGAIDAPAVIGLLERWRPVANQNVPSSLSLKRIGVPAAKFFSYLLFVFALTRSGNKRTSGIQRYNACVEKYLYPKKGRQRIISAQPEIATVYRSSMQAVSPHAAWTIFQKRD